MQRLDHAMGEAIVGDIDGSQFADSSVEITVIIAASGGGEALDEALRLAVDIIETADLKAELIVADYTKSGRQSAESAARPYRTTVIHDRRGYGAAVRKAAAAASGRWLLLIDGNAGHDPRELSRLIMRLRGGDDLVLGRRRIRAGGLLARSVDAVCDQIVRGVYGADITDSQSGMLGLRRDLFEQLSLQAVGRDLLCELVVKASLSRVQMSQTEMTERARPRSRFRSSSDAWERLRPLILMCPQWTLMFPSYVLMMLGVVGFFVATWDSGLATQEVLLPMMSMSSLAVVVGFQLLQFGLFAKAAAADRGVIPTELGVARDRRDYHFERGASLSGLAMLVGVAFLAVGLQRSLPGWRLLEVESLRLTAPGITLFALGVQFLAGELSAGLLATIGSRPSDRVESSVSPEAEHTRDRSRSPWFAEIRTATPTTSSPTTPSPTMLAHPHRRSVRAPEAQRAPSTQLRRRDERTASTDAASSFSTADALHGE